jgi:hypothetical protein
MGNRFGGIFRQCDLVLLVIAKCEFHLRNQPGIYIGCDVLLDLARSFGEIIEEDEIAEISSRRLGRHDDEIIAGKDNLLIAKRTHAAQRHTPANASRGVPIMVRTIQAPPKLRVSLRPILPMYFL